MNKELTCNQVSALISFYIKGKLNQKLKEYVDFHLEKCPVCRKKINDLQNILHKFSKQIPDVKNHEDVISIDFRNRLSAYVDNELNLRENIRMKKLTVSNPNARKELESMYRFQKAMGAAYNKTKNDFKYDYSKNIMHKLQDGKDYTTTYFYKLTALFVLLLTAIVCGFFYLYL